MQSDIERQTLYDVTYMWNLKKKDRNELICRTETDSQVLKDVWLPKGARCGGEDGLSDSLGLAYAYQGIWNNWSTGTC